MASKATSYNRRRLKSVLMHHAQRRRMRNGERPIPMQRSPSARDQLVWKMNAELHKHLLQPELRYLRTFWLKLDTTKPQPNFDTQSITMITECFVRAVSGKWDVTYMPPRTSHDSHYWRFEHV